MNDEQRRHRVLGSLSRSRLLAVLGESRDWRSVPELADQVGLHSNTTREHLDQLVAAGLVERERSQPIGRGRPAFRYRAARRLDDATAYRSLASVLATELARRPDASADAVTAGERWGHNIVSTQTPVEDTTTDAVGRLVEFFEELGFAPTLDASARDLIELHRCPFGPLALEHGEVVCNVHLGLMRGALHEMGAPFDALSLEPFVQPDLCLAHVGSPGNDN